MCLCLKKVVKKGGGSHFLRGDDFLEKFHLAGLNNSVCVCVSVCMYSFMKTGIIYKALEQIVIDPKLSKNPTRNKIKTQLGAKPWLDYIFKKKKEWVSSSGSFSLGINKGGKCLFV